jgi:hypothetical protein
MDLQTIKLLRLEREALAGIIKLMFYVTAQQIAITADK